MKPTSKLFHSLTKALEGEAVTHIEELMEAIMEIKFSRADEEPIVMCFYPEYVMTGIRRVPSDEFGNDLSLVAAEADGTERLFQIADTASVILHDLIFIIEQIEYEKSPEVIADQKRPTDQ